MADKKLTALWRKNVTSGLSLFGRKQLTCTFNQTGWLPKPLLTQFETHSKGRTMSCNLPTGQRCGMFPHHDEPHRRLGDRRVSISFGLACFHCFGVPSHPETWNLTERSWKTIFL
ncbi:unnamed protein product [Effrenium voratum]|nr:unnamed protein product [Effrenium voratum]